MRCHVKGKSISSLDPRGTWGEWNKFSFSKPAKLSSAFLVLINAGL